MSAVSMSESLEMTRMRSPGYPSMPLGEAIDLVKKIHEANRTNPLDREAAAKDMGYTGISGRSAKVIADLTHFGLLEKAGKGGIRVSRRAVDILYPASPSQKRAALLDAANAPTLFSELRNHFADGLPSENALRSYLMRMGFVRPAIGPATDSFIQTYRHLQQENVIESYGQPPKNVEESGRSENDPSVIDEPEDEDASPPPPPPADQQIRKVPLMENERVIFVDEASPGQYLKLVASGELDATLLEALESFTNRWKKRLGVAPIVKGAMAAAIKETIEEATSHATANDAERPGDSD
jgi:hypothetical protein